MDRKQYLLQLVDRATDLDDIIRKKIVPNLQTFTEEKVETLIKIFEKSEDRLKRIEEGKSDEVSEELIEENHKNIKNKLDYMRTKEMNERKMDTILLEKLLYEEKI